MPATSTRRPSAGFFAAPALRRLLGAAALCGLLPAAAQAQAPVVTGLSPARNALAVPRTAPVTVTFDQALSPTSAAGLRLRGALTGQQRGPVVVSGKQLTLPAPAFQAGEVVSATVTQAVQSSGGQALARPQVFQFTTATAPSSGTFGGGSDQALSNGVGVSVGDVNGDGFPDLLFIDRINTATEINHTVNVRLNDGRGTFGSAQAVEVGVSPTSLALGDMDNDGDLDLVVGAGIQNTSAINIALNDGKGTFGSPQSYSIFGHAPHNLVLGDINSDGYLDVVASYGPYDPTAAFINDREGSVSLMYTIPSASNGSLALGDVNGDGYLDLLSASTLDGPNVYVSLNKSPRAALFGESTKVAIGTAENDAAEAVAVGDVNGDGFLDFVAKHNAQISVRLNDGHGNFSGSQEVPAGGASSERSVALADVNGDGFLDLLAINAQQGMVSIYLNDGTGAFSRRREVAVGKGYGEYISLADLNGDGTLDIVTLSNERLSVRLNQPATPPPPAPLAVTRVSPARNALAAPRTTPVTVTFNQALANNTATQGALKVFSQQAGGRKAGAATVSGTLLTFSPTTPFKAGETVRATISGAAQGNNGTAAAPQVFQFTTATAPTAGTFEQGQRVLTNRLLTEVVTGDVNGDGKLDIVTADAGNGTLSVRINNGDGTFLDNTTAGGGRYDRFVSGVVRSLALGDLDGDGDLDIVYTSYIRENLPGSVGILLNNGDATNYTAVQGIPLGAGPRQVVLGDVDGDGDLDLLTTSTNPQYASVVNVRLNDGQGRFSVAQDIVRPADYLALGDMDGDGDLDLLATSYNYSTNSSVITLSLNDGKGTFGTAQIVAPSSILRKLILQDLDGDGDLDVFALEDSGSVSVQFNDGTGGLTSRQKLPTPGSPNNYYENIGFTAGDVDGDGDIDLLLGLDGTVSKWTNNGAGLFSAAQTIATSAPTIASLALGDIDDDADLDLLIGQTGQGNSHVDVRLNQNPTLPPVASDAYRFNAGGPALTTSFGAFATDQYASPSSRTATTTAPIAGTSDPALYQTERYSTNGTLSYAVPVANGTYTVVLHFAEIYWTQPGQRVFDVALEGAKKLTNYDIVREVGPRTATTKTFTVTVTDGVLNVDLSVPYLSGGRDQAKLAALEILPPTPRYQLNAGGPALTTSRGAFIADRYYSDSSRVAATTAPIAGTPDQALYRTERYSTRGVLSYAVPVVNGRYSVVLHFAEIYWQQPGQRVFDINLEGRKVVTNYDILTKVAPFTATTETFAVTVTDGVLNLDLTVPYLSGGRDQAKLSALQVLRLDGDAPLGANTVAAAATLQEEARLAALSVYPNPASGNFTLSLTSPAAQTATLTLTDQLGRVVHTQALTLQAGANQVPVQAAGLAAGLYQLTLRTADGQRLTSKVSLRP